MARRLYSTLFWLFLAGSSIALFPVALLLWAATAPFDRRLRALHAFTCFWASLYTWLNPAWPVAIEGRERLSDDDARVLVANHLSLLDILVLFRLFRHFKWVSKIENFRVPFIGWNMRLNRYIPLRRGDRASVQRMMEACERTLGAGSSVLMFPEGTRSTTGRMRPFKPGAFELALRTGRPVQPLVIRGTAEALPRRGFVLRGRHPIRITVLDPVAPADYAGKTAEALADEIRARMAAVLGEPPEPGPSSLPAGSA